MIPLRDANPRATFPIVTVLLILTNVLVFLYTVSLTPPARKQLLFTFGMIPLRFELLLGPHTVTLDQAALPLVTSIFLHSGWLHLIGNMWFLWVFGDNIEDRLGPFGYLFYYLLCGIGAGLVHAFFNLNSQIPSVGASGAISGILGAYIILYPRAKILTLFPLLFLFFTVQLPAIWILGYWFAIQLLSGLGSVGAGDSGGVAWWAHVGGFIIGAVLILIWPKRPRVEVIRY